MNLCCGSQRDAQEPLGGEGDAGDAARDGAVLAPLSSESERCWARQYFLIIVSGIEYRRRSRPGEAPGRGGNSDICGLLNMVLQLMSPSALILVVLRFKARL